MKPLPSYYNSVSQFSGFTSSDNLATIEKNIGEKIGQFVQNSCKVDCHYEHFYSVNKTNKVIQIRLLFNVTQSISISPQHGSSRVLIIGNIPENSPTIQKIQAHAKELGLGTIDYHYQETEFGLPDNPSHSDCLDYHQKRTEAERMLTGELRIYASLERS